MIKDPFSPEQVLMDANIREFGQAISLICALETGGKLSAEEAYELIRKTWRDLRHSHKLLMRTDESDEEK